MTICRQWRVPDSERNVDERPDLAASSYAQEQFRLSIGDVVFIEVYEPARGWVMWRTQCLGRIFGYAGLFTVETTEEEAREEMREMAVATGRA